MITVASILVDKYSRYGTFRNLCLYDDSQITDMKKVTDAIHCGGAVACAQLLHPSSSSLSKYNNGMRPVAASAIGALISPEIPREITKNEIAFFVKEFGEAARRAKAAGFDAIEIHCCHRHGLLGNFLSPLHNKRTDEYGGTVDGRLKMPLEARLTLELIINTIVLVFCAFILRNAVATLRMIFGILLGVFTPAESGAVAVAAAVVAGLIYRKFSLKILPKVFLRSVTTTAGIFIIIGFGNIIGWTMAADNVPTKIQNAVLGLTHNGYIIILMMFAILIVVGCAMEATAAQLIFTPVLTPLAMYAGMDPVQFGVWFCIMITIGLVTPPVGMTLFVTSNITKIPLERISKTLLPFIIAALLVTLVMMIVSS